MAHTLENPSQLKSLLSKSPVAVLDFWATWAEPSVQLNTVVDQLANVYSNITFIKIEAEQLSEVTEHYEVSAVPTFLFIKNNQVIDKVEGANGPQLADKVTQISKQVGSAPTSASKTEPENLNARLEKLINYAPVMIFIKGTPTTPVCGFSSKLVEILNKEGIKYDSFNILSDEAVRQGLKTFSNWPTFPQVYVQGKLIGGLDIVKEMVEEGELKDLIPPQSLTSAHVATKTAPASSGTETVVVAKKEETPEELKSRIETLLKSSPVLLFMKGSPSEPKCGFSSKIVNILNEQKIKYNSFNILADEAIRTGLKEYSNWPTYPQLYINAKLIGGLDIVKEMAEEGELLDLVPPEAKN